jgi:transglutaminase-like putative cysteine protease
VNYLANSSMSSPVHSGIRLAHPILQRFFDVSLYLLLSTGFAILAGTGKLDALSLILGTTALAGKGYLLARQSNAVIPEQWTNYLTLVYVAFFAFDYFAVSQTFISALVHLVLFAAMVKIFSIHRERDYVYLSVLAFGMVLAAAVLTVDSLFFGIFCVFVLLAVMTFVSMEMRRSWILAQPSPDSEVRDVRDLTLFPASVSRACVLLVLGIVGSTAVLFFLIPRRPSAGYLTAFASRSDLSTGFSEEVRLGEIGTIQQSSAVLMHVTFDQGSIIPRDLRWRGVALTTFDGRRWTGAHEGGASYKLNPSWQFRYGDNRLLRGNGPRVSYKVSLEPFGSRVFFVLPEALSLNGRYQAIRVDSTGSIFNGDPSHAITDYAVVSEIPPPMRPGQSNIDDPGVSGLIYLQTPSGGLDPRISELAQRVAASNETEFGKASAIERYLSTSYGYTLQLPSITPRDPVANFLFERKQGHCEYFASSMVLMLRTLGIPSRVVNGFRGGEYNDVTGSYIIRARDAHSWVEAYFAGYGWYTFDPTPAAVISPNSWNRLFLYADAMREFWHEWIVNYDSGHQTTLGVKAVRQGRSGIDGFRDWCQRTYENSLKLADAMRKHFQHHLEQWAIWMTLGFVLLVSLTLGPKLFLALRRLRLKRNPHLEPHSAATIWYERALRLLQKRGIRKLPTQTPQEFLNTIPQSSARQHLESFTLHYERARFADSADDAKKLPELYRALETVGKD